jgi:hypothetical protein
VESAAAALTAVLLVLTLVQSDWLEVAFHIDPDRGSGAAEWAVVCACLATTLVASILAGQEWRRGAATTEAP